MASSWFGEGLEPGPPTFEIDQLVESYCDADASSASSSSSSPTTTATATATVAIRLTVKRLLAIADRCTADEAVVGEAYLRAAELVKAKLLDTALYQHVLEHWNERRPQDEPGRQYDGAWMQKTRQLAEEKEQTLSTELRSYRNNLFWESIRMGQIEMAALYCATGRIEEASSFLAASREHVHSARETWATDVAVAKISLLEEQYDYARQTIGNVLLVEERCNALKYDERQHAAYIYAIACTCEGQYETAARTFLSAYSNTHAEVEAGSSSTRLAAGLLSRRDVAIYTGLCVLASYSRTQMSELVEGGNEESSKAACLLEDEPIIRNAIRARYDSHFADQGNLLKSYGPDFGYDIFLSGVLPDLYDRIRRRSVQQAMLPFDRINLSTLAHTFGVSEAMAEDVACAIIRAGELDFRIDKMAGVLESVGAAPLDLRDTVDRFSWSSRLFMNYQVLSLSGMEVRRPIPQE